MRTSYRKYQIAAIVISAILAAGDASHASIQTYGFYKITNNGNPDVGAQLSVEVSDVAGFPNQVTFRFLNNVGTSSSITDIYFDDGTLLDLSTITDSGAGVAFDDPATPGNLPGGNNADPDFNVTQDFSIDSDNPVSQNGVNSASEWVKILFTLQSGQTYADTIASLADGSLRIGLHVQAIGAPGGSDSYVNLPPVPEAASVIVWSLLGAMGICYKVRRSRLG